jgi:hypothetical protein
MFAGITLFLVMQALVFGIASYGVPIHWSCFIVAGASLALAGVAFFVGRSDADRPITPQRTLHQFQEGVRLSKEQFT